VLAEMQECQLAELHNGSIVMNMRNVRFFVFCRQEFTLEDAIAFHGFAPIEASKRVTNVIPLGRPLCLPVRNVNCVQTLKAHLNKCDCRAASISHDGGATWSEP
jgi:hypothetical protein